MALEPFVQLGLGLARAAGIDPTALGLPLVALADELASSVALSHCQRKPDQ
jgi:hypothetical protein